MTGSEQQFPSNVRPLNGDPHACPTCGSSITGTCHGCGETWVCSRCHDAPACTGPQETFEPSAFWYCSCRHPNTKVYYADQVAAERAEVERMRTALRRIADTPAEPRPDGTHNYSREALIDIARRALEAS